MLVRMRHVVGVVVGTLTAACFAASASAADGPGFGINNGPPIFGSSLELTGSITGGSAYEVSTYRAECGPDTTYGTLTPNTPVTSGEPIAMRVNVGSYPVGTVLHCRFVAMVGVSAEPGPDMTITVAAPSAPEIAPMSGDYGVGTGGEDTPMIFAGIDGGNRPTTARVMCGTGSGYPIQLPSKDVSPGSQDVAFNLWSKLLPYAKTYTCIVRAANSLGTVDSEPVAVELPTSTPRMFMNEDRPIVDNTFKLSGWLDPAGSASTFSMSCVGRFNTHEATVTKPAGATNLDFAVDLGPFDRDEAYTCTTTIRNASGEVGWTDEWRIENEAPAATTASLSFAAGRMSVRSRVHTGGLTTIAQAECGTSPGTYPLVSAEVVMPISTMTNTVTPTINGLRYLTRYYCRVKASNTLGTTYGLPLSIVTASAIGPVSVRDGSVNRAQRVYLSGALAARSSVTTSVFRRVAGRVSGGRCKAGATVGRKCTALLYRGKVKVLRAAGKATWAVPTVFSGRALPIGSYTAKVQTTDPATGRVTGMRSITFRVVS